MVHGGAFAVQLGTLLDRQKTTIFRWDRMVASAGRPD
jgi:hypothetical protein